MENRWSFFPPSAIPESLRHAVIVNANEANMCARENVAKLPKIGERLDAVRFKKALPELELDAEGFDFVFVVHQANAYALRNGLSIFRQRRG